MRILIISDIHSNLQALEAVLAGAPDHDMVWNLGDVVGYGANPNEVVDRVAGLGDLVVRGNHDRACSGLIDTEDFSRLAATAAHWTRSVLSAEHRLWLQALEQGPLAPGSPDVSCVHGSPFDEDEYIETEFDARLALEAATTRITFFGHTHLQGGFAANGREIEQLTPCYNSVDAAGESSLQLKRSLRYVLNPGSVGQPRDCDWRAAFAVYDDARELLTWHRVPYDLAEAQDRILSAGLPERLAHRLSEGH